MRSLKYFMAVVVFALFLLSIGAHAQTTAFTYQGKLSSRASSVTTPHDMQFRLSDTETVTTGTQHGPVVVRPNVQVTNGVFAVQLDFGDCETCFDGSPRFLEISVRPVGSSGTFTTLSPRQQVTSTPYAQKSIDADKLGGVAANQYVLTTDARMSDARPATSVSFGSAAVTGILPITNGGTGSSTKNFVDLSTAQTISGNKTFTGPETVVGGAFYATLGQTFLTAYGTSSLNLTTGSTSFQQIPGLSVSTNSNNGYSYAHISANGGIQVASNNATGFTIVEIAIFQDGVMLPKAGSRYFTVSNTSTLVSQIGNWSIEQLIGLETPAHTIDVRARIVSPSNSGATVSSGLDVLRGVLNVAVLRTVSGRP